MYRLALILVFLLSVSPAHAGVILEPQTYTRSQGDSAVYLHYPKAVRLTGPSSDPAVLQAINERILQAVELDKVESRFAEGVAEWNLEYTAHSTDRLLSVHFTGFDYYFGAAHPNDYIVNVNVELATGKEIRLDDLFRSGYLEVLNPLVANALYMGNCGEYDLEYTGVKWDQPFHLDQGNLYVDFQKYEVGPGVCGSLSAQVPLSDMAPFIDPSGPLGD